MRGAAVLPRVLAVALAAAACQEHRFEPPSREERVERADSLYAPALFDTIGWASDSARFLEGNIVYASQCRDCHGPLGQGDTEYAREKGLEAPSLVEPGWEHGANLEVVRRRIFTGHPAGMPTWGIARITPREVDAVAHYVLEGLRAGAAGGGGRGVSPPAPPAALPSRR